MVNEELIARREAVIRIIMDHVVDGEPETPEQVADAILAVLESRPEREWARSVAETMEEGDGFWRACSGCQESVDGCVSTHDYPYSEVFRCQPGGGCGECGGLGVIWDDIDYDAMARDILATETPVAGGEQATDRRCSRCDISEGEANHRDWQYCQNGNAVSDIAPHDFVTPKPTTPERAKALEEARTAFYAESIVANELLPTTQVLAVDSFLRAVGRIAALSASPPEVVESQD